jgi:hypothetical protein
MIYRTLKADISATCRNVGIKIMENWKGGDLAIGRLGKTVIGQLGDQATGEAGDWASGRLGDWAIW